MAEHDDEYDPIRGLIEPEYRIDYEWRLIERKGDGLESLSGSERDAEIEEIARLKRRVRMLEASADPSW